MQLSALKLRLNSRDENKKLLCNAAEILAITNKRKQIMLKRWLGQLPGIYFVHEMADAGASNTDVLKHLKEVKSVGEKFLNLFFDYTYYPKPAPIVDHEKKLFLWQNCRIALDKNNNAASAKFRHSESELKKRLEITFETLSILIDYIVEPISTLQLTTQKPGRPKGSKSGRRSFFEHIEIGLYQFASAPIRRKTHISFALLCMEYVQVHMTESAISAFITKYKIQEK